MQDASKAGKAVGGAIDVVPDQVEIGQSDGAELRFVGRRPYSDLPDRSKKWPKPVRIAFIAGSAAALWALIFAGIKLL